MHTDNSKFTVYLSGEIHTNWREEIIKGAGDMPITFYTPELDHDSSDNCGDRILGNESDNFWKDHKAAKINSIRIKSGIEKSDIVIVKFGDKFRQWNAAYDAGYAVALGKMLIVIHPEEFTHALKEVDSSAKAVVRNNKQVLDLLRYISR